MGVCVFPVGLIHANHGQKIIEYLTKELCTNQNEVSVWWNSIHVCTVYTIFSFVGVFNVVTAVLSVAAKKSESKQKKGSTSDEGEKEKDKEEKTHENMEVVSYWVVVF